MRYLSVCSGIEAATVAWRPLGWQAVAFSEIEKFPCAVLKHHYPDVPNWGDMTNFEDWPDESIDLLVGGTPCQSFSVAGLRKGLADPRGNLMLTYLAILERYRPRWMVWENVPGVFSSLSHAAPDPCPPPNPMDLELDGQEVELEDEYDSEELHAFNSFLAALSELGVGCAYRVLDAQHCGVPQRRRRVIVVGYLGDWRRAAAVLFERESLQGHSAPRRKTGPSVAALTATGVGTCGADDNQGQAGHLIPQAYGGNNTSGPIEVATALNACGTASGRQDFETETFVADRAPALSASNPYGDHESREGLLVAHTLRAEGFDASEDGTGRGTPLVPVPFDTTQITSGENRSNPAPGDPCHPLAAGAHAPAIAFSSKDHGADAGEIAPTLRAMGHDGSHANAGGQLAVAIQEVGKRTGKSTSDPRAGIGISRPGDPMFTLQAGAQHGVAVSLRGREGGSTAELSGNVSPALRASQGGGDKPYVLTPMAVRRLTPIECERLQGFPDNYTRIPWRGRPADQCPDGPRYKALGNSKAVPKINWIGKRIDLVDGIEAERMGSDT